MAVIENTYTGDGSTVLYSFTFPYLATTDVKVSLDGSNTTAYSLANATQVQLNTAPASGVAIRVYRDTADDNLTAEFFPGAAIKSSDLNNNFNQNLYVTQESNDLAEKASTTANTAQSTANTALTTANSASTVANSSVSDASAAVTTANAASTAATSAVTTANAASATANAASSAVATAGFYTPIAALANLPGSPANQDRVEVINSTGIESSSSVSGVPSGFAGASDLTVRLQYNSSTSKWAWQQYFAADPEARYVTANSAAFTGTPTAPTAAQGTNTTQVATTAFVNSEISSDLTAAIGSTVQAYDADTTKNDVANTFTAVQTFTPQTVHSGGIDSNGTIDLDGSLEIDGAYKQTAEAVSALDIDLSTGNYFTKTISANSTFTFSNPPASGTVGSFTLELTHTSGTVTWPTSVKFNADTAPTLTTGKTHLFFFVTDDGGTRYRGAALVDYVN